MHVETTFHWRKKGRIFCPDGRYDWMQTHSQNPTALLLSDRTRVYINCRPKRGSDGSMTALPTFVDLDPADPGRILAVHDKPLVGLGEPGTFDQFGVMVRGIIAESDHVKLYYAGWNRCIGVPYNHAIGLAISTDGGTTFSRYSKGPVLSRTHKEPFIQNCPFVKKIDGVYHMWYSTGTRWVEWNGSMESIYVLVHAVSPDGIEWERDGVPCIPVMTDDECQTNAAVVKIGNRYHMWFSHRRGTDFRNAERGYRNGYAWSDDLRTWHRDDALSVLPASEGEDWDSEMICYPEVVDLNGTLTMFYCGNGFGRTGFGYAVLDNTH